MTYEEIKTKIEGSRPDSEDYESLDDWRSAVRNREENALLTAEWPERVAFKILAVLDGRKGFEWWWRDIYPEDKESVFREMVTTIENAD